MSSGLYRKSVFFLFFLLFFLNYLKKNIVSSIYYMRFVNKPLEKTFFKI
ncbi:MAG TPA: hypothetical protein DHV15_10765 [Treponema sp.]|uniref:Uncharacterized protein n=1 Tax=Treponema denticola (strain ATCC 35405 / DSM 14222 / CIP 103919 / JCM 8153 / KCTC 15104) TaxID=243275 RepID=Q73NF7_TREDE|nr:hypothetical protein TDE_1196 [Treponema denticola ATCC 35405]HCY95966.1 hypothetical protein [Treponema sp.]